MQADTDQLIAAIGVIVAMSVAYGQLMGPPQQSISQAVIDAWQVPQRYRRITNMGVGIGLGIALTVVGAFVVGAWALVPGGVLAGLLASVKASQVHDAEKPEPHPPKSRFTAK